MSQYSEEMLQFSKHCFFQSNTALKAEINSNGSFYNAEMHLKMLSTVFFHLIRCIANLVLSIYCLFSVVFKPVCFEEDAKQSVKNRFRAAGTHFVAAGVDFINVFVSAGALLTRTIIAMVDGYDCNDKDLSSNEQFKDDAIDELKHATALPFNGFQ